MTLNITKKSIAVGVVMVSLFSIAMPTVSQKVTSLAIKPVASTTPQSDEQQGISAVRRAKISVVNIVGSTGAKSAQTDSVFGTGFIVSSDGYIISNNHVVEDKNATYRAELFTGQQFEARVVGVDPYADIAVLKIEAKNLTPIPLGNSDVLETGQSVFAIGYSLGKYQNSVTKGVVSGLGRNIALGTNLSPKPRMQNLIQTDASISPGNSGGPLINMAGEVVGMSTLMDTEGQSLGFAIPINAIKDSYAQLKTLGKVARAYLGVSFQTVDSKIKYARQLDIDNGALVLGLDNKGPAARAGVQLNDIIVSVNGEPLTATNELDTYVQKKFQAGNQILLKLYRGKTYTEVVVLLGEYK